jgi:hypothetical protein
VTLQTFAQKYNCLYDDKAFTAKQGQVVSMNLTSSSAISFFVLKGPDFDEWLKGGQCTVTGALVEAQDVTYYYGELVVPDDGHYYFLFLNFFHDKAAKVGLTAKIKTGVATEFSSVITTTVTSQTYLTVSETFVATATKTLTSIRTEQVGFAGIPGFPVEAILVGLAGGLVALTLIRRRK